MTSTTVILGGGVGGLATARALRKRLGRDHRIVVVDRDDQHRFAASLLWVLSGDRQPADLARPLTRLATRGVEFVHASVSAIDPAARAVTLDDGQTLTADHLVVALGAELDRTKPPGLAEHGHCPYDVDGVVALRTALAALEDGRVVVLTAAPAYKCPAAPYEAAMLLEYDCRKRKVRESVQVDLYTAEPGPMGVAGPAVSAAVREMVTFDSCPLPSS